MTRMMINHPAASVSSALSAVPPQVSRMDSSCFSLLPELEKRSEVPVPLDLLFNEGQARAPKVGPGDVDPKAGGQRGGIVLARRPQKPVVPRHEGVPLTAVDG